jgi:3-oxoacyl-[acyl-carrier protein] reductase
MLLENKTAVVYGAAGGIGSAVSRAFAAEGARVFLAGRTESSLQRVAEQIRAAGGSAETAVVDALDAEAVDVHADAVAAAAGGIDVSFNLITHPYTFGTPLAEMAVDDFLAPIVTAARTTFLTVKAAARHMIPRGSGVILALGGSGDPLRDQYLGGTQVAFEAVESVRQQASSELGRHGIRFVTLRTGGIVDTFPEFEGRDEIVDGIVKMTMLGRGATLQDVCDTAVFAASDRARSMTAATLNISAGALVD